MPRKLSFLASAVLALAVLGAIPGLALAAYRGPAGSTVTMASSDCYTAYNLYSRQFSQYMKISSPLVVGGPTLPSRATWKGKVQWSQDKGITWKDLPGWSFSQTQQAINTGYNQLRITFNPISVPFVLHKAATAYRVAQQIVFSNGTAVPNGVWGYDSSQTTWIQQAWSNSNGTYLDWKTVPGACLFPKVA